MTQNYHPELDDSPDLQGEAFTMFQEHIGILRWVIGLGRLDIWTELFMLSTYQASPQHGHMNQLYHIFAYLKSKLKLTMFFNAELPRYVLVHPWWWPQNISKSILQQTRGNTTKTFNTRTIGTANNVSHICGHFLHGLYSDLTKPYRVQDISEQVSNCVV